MSDMIDLIVIGAGPGGYSAAFYAADLGLNVALIEQDEALGGVCLNRGCIPSKALLHAAGIMAEIQHAGDWGISVENVRIDPLVLAAKKDSIVAKLSGGIRQLARSRKIRVLTGAAAFVDSHHLAVNTAEGQETLAFQHCIIATGTSPLIPNAFHPEDARIWDSTKALAMDTIPDRLAVIGGGIIGLELGTVYARLGSQVTVIEALDRMLPGADADLVRAYQRHTKALFSAVHTSARVTDITPKPEHLECTFQTGESTETIIADRILVAIGRTPNSRALQLQHTAVTCTDRGFIATSPTCQTADPAIYAIGDIAGGIQLAHKASREARIAVDAILGRATETNDQLLVPSVVYTDPELAWAGLTEDAAKAENRTVKTVKFPWAACGKSLTMDRSEGFTKLILEPDTDRILGMALIGPHAGDMIAEGVVAIQQGMTAAALGNCIHPHPTLSETVMEAAHMAHQLCTHVFVPKRPEKTTA